MAFSNSNQLIFKSKRHPDTKIQLQKVVGLAFIQLISTFKWAGME